MRSTKKALVSLICLFAIIGFALPAHAAGITVASLRADTSSSGFSGMALVVLNGWTSTSCTGAYSAYMAFDATTAAGKSTLAVLTAALLSGKSITVAGTNTCGAYGANIELLSEVTLVN
jgi:hypothetical protein